MPQSLVACPDWPACRYRPCGAYRELRVHSGSPAIPDGQCGGHLIIKKKKKKKVEFVGYTIGSKGVRMSDNKVKDILASNVPRSIHEVQQFLEFANFYRRFVRSYIAICALLTHLMKKGQIWNWTTECQEAFELLKKCFMEAPIQVNYHTNKPLMIETDASDLAKGAVLSQYEEGDKKWPPVAFYSKKFSPAELNHDVHDKEMVVIVDCMRKWRHMLVGCPRRVVVYTNH